MTNLNIKPFTRIIWVSREARSTWAEGVRRAGAAVRSLETSSVAQGARECAWVTVPSSRYIEWAATGTGLGLSVVPVSESRHAAGFSHLNEPPRPGEDRDIKAVVARSPESAARFIRARQAADHAELGLLLGYPKCCWEFFAREWESGHHDPIYEAAQATAGWPGRLTSSPFSNPFLRYVGLRTIFHIPHALDCPLSAEIGKAYLELIPDRDAAQILEALLSMPASWDAYRGILIIRTPIFIIETTTTFTADRHYVEMDGSFIPEEAATGLRFPFRPPRD